MGIGYRAEIAKELYLNRHKISTVEVITERYINSSSDFERLKKISEEFKVLPHGVSLSISSNLFDRDYLRKIKMVCQITRCEYYTEHLCLTRAPGIDIGHLSPIRYTDQNLKKIIKNVNLIQDFLEMPLVLENISYSFELPGNSMSHEEFFYRLSEETNCGLLVDVTNLHTNAYNHQFDPYHYINNLPLNKVIHVHIAGGYYDRNGELIDSHSQAVEQRSFELLEYLHKKTSIKTVILEHDSNFPDDIQELLSLIEIANMILKNKDWKAYYNKLVKSYQT